jgi:hypothetical protein
MATIKTQNGKVILKNGKVSCECCDSVLTCNGPTSGQNVFEISKEEYIKYSKGGTWNVSTTWAQSESADPNCAVSGTGSGSVSATTNGCIHVVNGTANATTVFTGACDGDFTVNYTFGFGITLELGIDNSGETKRYYAKYYAFSNVSDSSLTSSPRGFPANVNFIVDGNNLIAFGNWFPGWENRTNYTNNSSIQLTATFIPNP